MSTLTLRFPDDKHVQLKQLAASRAISVNKLLDELATQFQRGLASDGPYLVEVVL